MPHPSDFEKYTSAVTDEERKQFWASLPAQTMTAAVRARAADAGAAPWLRSLMDMGGLCFPRTLDGFRETSSFTDHPMDAPFVPMNFLRIDAVARMVNMAWLEEVPSGGADHTTVNMLSMANLGAEWRRFHADFCKMLVADDLAWREEAVAKGHDRDWVNASDHATAVRSTLGVALATACMLNNTDSVKLIAEHDPATMNVMMDIKVTGAHWAMGLVDLGQPPTVTPYFCAMQFSAPEAMDALVAAGLDTSFAMGMDPRKKGLQAMKKPFDVLSLGAIFSPSCEPEVYEKALHQRLATADNKTLQKFTRDAIELLSASERDDKVVFKYIPSLIKAGAFDRDPDRAAAEACTYGVPVVLQHVLQNVEWRSFATDLMSKDSPLYLASQNAFTSNRPEAYDVAMATFFKGVAGAGFEKSALTQTVLAFGDEQGQRLVPQPIHNLVKLDARHTINAMLQKGLDPNQRAKEGIETPMEIAVRLGNGVDNLMRTALARAVANAALAEMDAEMAQPLKRAAP